MTGERREGDGFSRYSGTEAGYARVGGRYCAEAGESVHRMTGGGCWERSNKCT